MRHAASNVLEQLEHERATLAEQVDAIEPEDARRRLLDDWDVLDFDARRALLRRAVAEVVVTDEGVRVTRRR